MDKLIAWATKYAILLIVGAVAVIVLVVMWIRHDNQIAVNAAAPAIAQSKVNAADAQSGKDAVNAVNKNGDNAALIDALTRKNNAIILKIPGAEVTLNPALDAAGRSAVCLRESAAGLPECERLLHPNP